ncbi:hypothetical protein LCGC14_0404790 [marine sediment metagenome]|uniref:Yip1 domain-containing protein n=1 Tax=marine sediment metagenome TaxID=412755 RepID=A0A0F9T1D5_9ZZZZ|nr:MAG: hypothetical protein Lokiarch_26750 [Candidatus Lokiarchaeum sp. GC14_75]
MIEQKEDKKYYLTKLGIYAFNSLKDNIKTIKAPNREFKSQILEKFMVLTSKRFILFNKKDRIYTLIISIGILILGTVLSFFNGFTSLLLFFIDINLENLQLIYQIILNLSFVLNFFAFFIIVESISRILYKKKDSSTLNFLISFAIILFPMVLYLIIHSFFEVIGLNNEYIVNFIDKALMIIFQVWSLWILSYSLSVKKGIKIESSLIISLLLHYSGFTIILLTLV